MQSSKLITCARFTTHKSYILVLCTSLTPTPYFKFAPLCVIAAPSAQLLNEVQVLGADMNPPIHGCVQWLSFILTLLMPSECVAINNTFAVRNCHFGSKIGNQNSHNKQFIAIYGNELWTPHYPTPAVYRSVFLLPAANPAGLCFANINLLGDYLVSGCASGCVSYSGYAGGCVIY